MKSKLSIASSKVYVLLLLSIFGCEDSNEPSIVDGERTQTEKLLEAEADARNSDPISYSALYKTWGYCMEFVDGGRNEDDLDDDFEGLVLAFDKKENVTMHVLEDGEWTEFVIELNENIISVNDPGGTYPNFIIQVLTEELLVIRFDDEVNGQEFYYEVFLSPDCTDVQFNSAG